MKRPNLHPDCAKGYCTPLGLRWFINDAGEAYPRLAKRGGRLTKESPEAPGAGGALGRGTADQVYFQ